METTLSIEKKLLICDGSHLQRRSNFKRFQSQVQIIVGWINVIYHNIVDFVHNIMITHVQVDDPTTSPRSRQLQCDRVFFSLLSLAIGLPSSFLSLVSLPISLYLVSVASSLSIVVYSWRGQHTAWLCLLPLLSRVFVFFPIQTIFNIILIALGSFPDAPIIHYSLHILYIRLLSCSLHDYSSLKGPTYTRSTGWNVATKESPNGLARNFMP